MTRCDFAMSVIGNPTHCELPAGHAGPHCYTAMLGNSVTFGGENVADIAALTARLTGLEAALREILALTREPMTSGDIDELQAMARINGVARAALASEGQ